MYKKYYIIILTKDWVLRKGQKLNFHLAALKLIQFFIWAFIWGHFYLKQWLVEHNLVNYWDTPSFRLCGLGTVICESSLSKRKERQQWNENCLSTCYVLIIIHKILQSFDLRRLDREVLVMGSCWHFLGTELWHVENYKHPRATLVPFDVSLLQL